MDIGQFGKIICIDTKSIGAGDGVPSLMALAEDVGLTRLPLASSELKDCSSPSSEDLRE